MELRVWIWLLSLSVLWGGSFFFAKVAVGELEPLTVVFLRVGLAALALNAILLARGINPVRRGSPWAAYLVMGILNNALPFSLIFWAQTRIPSGLASILNATTPLFTLVVAHWLTRDEKIDAAKVAALLVGLGGVIVLIGPDLLLEASSLWGQLACLAAALSYALAGELRSEEHTSELQSLRHLVCRLLLEKKKHYRRTPMKPQLTHMKHGTSQYPSSSDA